MEVVGMLLLGMTNVQHILMTDDTIYICSKIP